MTLRIRLQTNTRPGPDPAAQGGMPPGGLIFTSLPTGRVPGGWQVLSSMAAHVAAIALVAVVSHHVSAYLRDEQVDWSRYRVESLRLHLAEPLFFRAAAGPNPPEPPPTAGESADHGAADPRRESAGAAGPRVPRRLELPVLPQITRTAAIILQPDFLPQTAPPPTLPPLAFWARQGTDLPKPPPPNRVVVPGRTEERSTAPSLAAPPVLAVPNREPEIAQLNVSLPPSPAPKPAAIQLADSATAPVRLRDDTETFAASFDGIRGQAADVLSLAAERRDLKDVEVPRGLQSIPGRAIRNSGSTVPRPMAAAGGKGESRPSDAGTGATSPKPGDDATASAQKSSGTSAIPVRNSSPATSTSPGAPASKTGDTPSTGQLAAGNNGAPRASGTAPATRIQHPANGNFDVVVMQSHNRDDLPDGGGILTGNPVYTVYLQVGDQREWLLEYCAPAVQTQQASPYEINVDDSAAISPPYPISTTIPNDLIGQPITRQIILHGLLTANGSLRNMRASNTSNPLAIQIVGLLTEWVFRPALRKEKPVAVEILLVIPPRG